MRQDDDAREIVRQAKAPASGNRLSAASGGARVVASSGMEPRIDDMGRVRRLFVPNTDPLDDAGFFLGDDGLEVF